MRPTTIVELPSNPHTIESPHIAKVRCLPWAAAKRKDHILAGVTVDVLTLRCSARSALV